MQIDFHHAVTYVTCRLAGFDRAQADTVAHAAQYVDDATCDGAVNFADGQRYVRVTSAHKTFDLKDNADQADNRLVWVPFHFLPGNQAEKETDPARALTRRLICRPGGDPALRMVDDCILRQDLPFALHRLGIALHSFADTWAHQQFVGMVSDFNRIDKVAIEPDPAYANDPVFGHLHDGAMKLQSFIANHLPVGHAPALTYPDMPFLKWSFTRSNGESVARDNPTDFLVAAGALYNAARRYLARDPSLPETPLPAADAEAIVGLLRSSLAIEGEDRHAAWKAAIAQGRFSFGPEQIDYVEQGEGSWKMAAVGADPDEESGDEVFEMQPDFLTSDWKLFHDAVQHQRLFVLHQLLPRYGICVS
jgi:hypothetical protein